MRTPFASGTPGTDMRPAPAGDRSDFRDATAVNQLNNFNGIAPHSKTRRMLSDSTGYREKVAIVYVYPNSALAAFLNEKVRSRRGTRDVESTTIQDD